jgi:hypothetical protein
MDILDQYNFYSEEFWGLKRKIEKQENILKENAVSFSNFKSTNFLKYSSLSHFECIKKMRELTNEYYDAYNLSILLNAKMVSLLKSIYIFSKKHGEYIIQKNAADYKDFISECKYQLDLSSNFLLMANNPAPNPTNVFEIEPEDSQSMEDFFKSIDESDSNPML